MLVARRKSAIVVFGGNMRIGSTVKLAVVASVLALCGFGSTAQASGVGLDADVCSLDLAVREGAWICPPTQAPSVAVSPFALPGPDAGGPWCISTWAGSACYSYASNNTVSTVKGRGFYGFGSTALGTVTFNVKTSLNGHQATLKGLFTPSNTVRDLEFNSALTSLNSMADGSLATVVYGETDHANFATLALAGVPTSWTSDPFYDAGHTFYSGEMGASWAVAGYSGYWYLNLRSAIYSCETSTSACYFSLYAPAEAITSGWNPF